jgi:hypothetical protein
VLSRGLREKQSILDKKGGLKVKIRNLLAVVAMLSVFLIGIGTAYAVTGVEDAVPGQDIVIPIICEGYQPDDAGGNPVGEPIFGSLNNVWAIAEVGDTECDLDDSVCVPVDMDGNQKNNEPGVTLADVITYDRLSIERLDQTVCWSKHDVISNQCTDLIKDMDQQARDAMEVVINNVTYFVGYVEYLQRDSCEFSEGEGESNTLVSWVYLNDVVKGFVSGFDGISMENGTGPELEELCIDGSCSDNFIGVTASHVFPRYYILNSDPDTLTWWIFLLGRNEYAVEYQLGLVNENNIHRSLGCFFCDENENCTSNGVPIPYELNVINVATRIPGSVWPSGWPISDPAGKRGFAYCTIDEIGSFSGQGSNTVISGTLSFDGVDGTSNTLPETYSLFGWSYQRAVPQGASAVDKLAVIHTIHRLYCEDTPDATELPDRFDEGTVDQCQITGFIPNPINP